MKDTMRDFGILALASRFRRITERLQWAGERVYAHQRIDFEPRWFPVFALLARATDQPPSITELARALGITHPAVIKLTADMIDRGLIESTPDPRDGRKRRLRLSERGRHLLAHLQPVWEGFVLATREILDETGTDILAVLDRLEDALMRKGLDDRIIEHLRRQREGAIPDGTTSEKPGSSMVPHADQGGEA